MLIKIKFAPSKMGKEWVGTEWWQEGGLEQIFMEHILKSWTLQDEEILTAWLTDLHYEEYYHLFTSAGYDMPTISR